MLKINKYFLFVWSFLWPGKRLFFYNKNNFGDKFNLDLFKYFLGSIVYCPSPRFSQIHGMGSIVQLIDRRFRGVVIGSGLIKDKKVNFNCKFLGVRGPLTLNSLKLNESEVCFVGDPGILASKIYPSVKNNKQLRYDLGIVLHYVDDNLKIKEYLIELFADKTICFVNVKKSPKDVFQIISCCKSIISSSLHGLIFADSQLIPNIQLIISDKIIGGNYKFDDYFLSINRIPHKNRVELSNLNNSDDFFELMTCIDEEILLSKQLQISQAIKKYALHN